MINDNFTLERDIIQKLNIIKNNKAEISRLKKAKEMVFDVMAEHDTFGLQGAEIASIITTYKSNVKEINDAIAPYNEGNSILEQSIADAITEDYKKKNVDTNLLINVTKEYPGIASVKISSERHLEFEDSFKERVIRELIDSNMIDMLDIDMEKYFEYSKKLYGQDKHHALGVIETAPIHKVKIAFKK